MKRKFAGLIMAVAMVFSVMPYITAGAAAVAGDFEYEAYGDHVEITSYLGDDAEVIIPAEIDGLPVTSIGQAAFWYSWSVESVTIPESVTVIKDKAFSDCGYLAKVSVPGSVKSIGESAFRNCGELVELSMADGIEYIGDNAFYGCYSLANISLPDSVVSVGTEAFTGTEYYNDSSNWEDDVLYIGNHLIKADYVFGSYEVRPGTLTIAGGAFSGCDGITDVAIPNSVISVGRQAFYDCGELSGITLPDSVKTIGGDAFYYTAYYNDSSNWEDDVLYIGNHLIKADYIFGSYEVKPGTLTIADNAFEYNDSLESVTIPDSVTGIGKYAFSECYSLASVNIPTGVTAIGEGTFMYCECLEAVTMGSGVTSIGDFAFGECGSLTELTLPAGLISIGELAFDSTGLTSVAVPATVISIGDSAFGGCDGLTEIEVDEANPVYKSIDGVLFNKSAACLIQYPAGNERTIYTVPDGTLTLGREAFALCRNLQEVTVADSVVKIGEGAFTLCFGLECVTIGSGTSIIGKRAFYSCDSLTEITVPDGVKRIGEEAFSKCGSLEQITIGSGVSVIDNRAFNGCGSLADVYYADGQVKWDSITAGSGNDPLYEAEIHFGRDNSVELKISAVSVTDAGVRVSVEPVNVPFYAEIMAVGCDESGNYIGAAVVKDGEAVLASESVSTVKIMCWESFGTLKPMCKPAQAPVEQ